MFIWAVPSHSTFTLAIALTGCFTGSFDIWLGTPCDRYLGMFLWHGFHLFDIRFFGTYPDTWSGRICWQVAWYVPLYFCGRSNRCEYPCTHMHICILYVYYAESAKVGNRFTTNPANRVRSQTRCFTRYSTSSWMRCHHYGRAAPTAREPFWHHPGPSDPLGATIWRRDVRCQPSTATEWTLHASCDNDRSGHAMEDIGNHNISANIYIRTQTRNCTMYIDT